MLACYGHVLADSLTRKPCKEMAMIVTSYFKGTKHDKPRIRSGSPNPREFVLIENVFIT